MKTKKLLTIKDIQKELERLEAAIIKYEMSKSTREYKLATRQIDPMTLTEKHWQSWQKEGMEYNSDKKTHHQLEIRLEALKLLQELGLYKDDQKQKK